MKYITSIIILALGLSCFVQAATRGDGANSASDIELAHQLTGLYRTTAGSPCPLNKDVAIELKGTTLYFTSYFLGFGLTENYRLSQLDKVSVYYSNGKDDYESVLRHEGNAYVTYVRKCGRIFCEGWRADSSVSLINSTEARITGPGQDCQMKRVQ